MRVAINGFGRIGRLVFRIMDKDPDFEIIAINNRSETDQIPYLLKYDSVHGKYPEEDISFSNDVLKVGEKKIKVISESDPELLPWKELNIDVVFECTGAFASLEDAGKHIKAGAKKVVVSAPCKGDVKTIVYGVNEDILTGDEEVISAASCTTNCLAPVLKVLDDNFGIEIGYMNTVHAYTNDQTILDGSHKKGINSRRGRTAGVNIIPTSTGAAKAIGLVLPRLDGKINGSSMRVPVSDGSVIDLTLELSKNVGVEEINNCLTGAKSAVLGVSFDPIVSSDVIGDTHGGVVDLPLTDVRKFGDKELVKVVAWYDNEYGYSNQMVRTAKYFGNLNA